jgi:hypothetical protein
MPKFAFLLTLLVAALVCFLPAPPAQAQAIRTFVSATGSDSNPCSITQPCRHFQAAVNATSVGGEVDALDPGAYGSFTISQAISIEGQGWSYVAPPANGAAITINAVSGNVNIRGVSLNGVGAANANGIAFNSGNSLHVQNSVIRNFANNGINFAPTTLTATQMLVSNTLVSDNGSNGIFISPTSGAGNSSAVVNNVEMQNNADGLVVDSNLQTIVVTISNSAISNSSITGVFANSDGSTLNLLVRNSTIVSNATGLNATGSNALIRVTRSTIVGNTIGWTTGIGGVVQTYADNNIDGNFNGGDNAPTCVNATSPCAAYK